MTFGEKLRKFRKEKHMTQSELAKKAGITLNTISNYEKGDTYPQDHQMYKILAEILDVDEHYLHNEDEHKATDSHSTDELVQNISALFAGGTLTEDELDGVMKAVSDVYWKCKEENRAKYSHK